MRDNRGRNIALIAVVAYTIIRYVTSPPAPGKLAGHVIATVAACAFTWFMWRVTTPRSR